MDNNRWNWPQRLRYNKHISGNNVTMVLGPCPQPIAIRPTGPVPTGYRFIVHVHIALAKLHLFLLLNCFCCEKTILYYSRSYPLFVLLTKGLTLCEHKNIMQFAHLQS
jgi:hypothetical protein